MHKTAGNCMYNILILDFLEMNSVRITLTINRVEHNHGETYYKYSVVLR